MTSNCGTHLLYSNCSISCFGVAVKRSRTFYVILLQQTEMIFLVKIAYRRCCFRSQTSLVMWNIQDKFVETQYPMIFFYFWLYHIVVSIVIVNYHLCCSYIICRQIDNCCSAKVNVSVNIDGFLISSSPRFLEICRSYSWAVNTWIPFSTLGPRPSSSLGSVAPAIPTKDKGVHTLRGPGEAIAAHSHTLFVYLDVPFTVASALDKSLRKKLLLVKWQHCSQRSPCFLAMVSGKMDEFFGQFQLSCCNK